MGTVPQALTVALRLGGGQDGGYGNFHLPVFPTSLFFFSLDCIYCTVSRGSNKEGCFQRKVIFI